MASSVLPARQLVLIAILSVCSVGCGSKPKEKLFAVKGRATLDGKPLTQGSVTLRPESTDTTWHQPTGIIESTGDYVVFTNGQPGAPPGPYRVVVFSTEATVTPEGTARPGLPKSLIPARYQDHSQTPLRLEVVAQPPASGYKLELSNP